jgi:hypothetical protein
MDLARAPRRARLTARKKGSGYENGCEHGRDCYVRHISMNCFKNNRALLLDLCIGHMTHISHVILPPSFTFQRFYFIFELKRVAV